jgi:hypothetical protein
VFVFCRVREEETQYTGHAASTNQADAQGTEGRANQGHVDAGDEGSQ